MHVIGSIHSNAAAGSNSVHHHQNQNSSSSVALITNNGGGAPVNHTTNGGRSNSSNSSSGSSSNNQSIDRVLNNPSNAVKTLVVRYNRRNNPELEKRRIHHCDFLGKSHTRHFRYRAKPFFRFDSFRFDSFAQSAFAAQLRRTESDRRLFQIIIIGKLIVLIKFLCCTQCNIIIQLTVVHRCLSQSARTATEQRKISDSPFFFFSLHFIFYLEFRLSPL